MRRRPVNLAVMMLVEPALVTRVRVRVTRSASAGPIIRRPAVFTVD
jgi:hypothetical protein